jgi:PAS domain S-box-containing protein
MPNSSNSAESGTNPGGLDQKVIAEFTERSTIPVMALDRDLCFVFANAAYCKALGRTFAQIRGQYVFDVYEAPPADQESFKRKCGLTFAGAITRSEIQTALVQDEEGRTRSVYWQATQEPFLDENGMVRYVLQRIEDVTHLVELQRSHDIVSAELDHRVKNLISVILATARITSPMASSVEQYTDEFCARVESMARIYDRMSSAGWRGLSLRSLFEEELTQVASRQPIQYSLKGKDIQLSLKATKDGGMIIHEFVANAAKYGCFAQPGGRLDVEWSISDAKLRVLWVETGGGVGATPRKAGFGTKLTEMLPNARVRREYSENGLRIEYTVPIEVVTHETGKISS